MKRITSDSCRKRINGFNVWNVGIQWEYVESSKSILENLLIYLADRRVLYEDVCRECDSHSIQSVIEIRKELIKAKQILKDDKIAFSTLSVMLMACRRFINEINDHMGDCKVNQRCYGEFRSSIGRELAYISSIYDIDIESELAPILPDEIDVTY